MKLAIFFTAFCCTIFVIQLIVYIRKTVNSTELYTETSREHLSDQPLPLRISICLKSGLNQTELRAAGYRDEASFSFGQRKSNISFFGWGGHTEDGKSLYTDVSVLEEKHLIWKKLSDVVKFFIISSKTDFEIVSEKNTINSMVQHWGTRS